MTRIQFTPREQAMAPLYAEFYQYTTAIEHYPHYHALAGAQVVSWPKFLIEVTDTKKAPQYLCFNNGMCLLGTESPQRAAAWAWQQLKEQARGLLC